MIEVWKSNGQYKETDGGLGAVNYSDLFSFLIKETVANVANYHSDIFYDLKTIETAITTAKRNEIVEPIYIGFRDCGVDGNYHFLYSCREYSYEDIKFRYNALYVVTIRQTDNWWAEVKCEKLEESDLMMLYYAIHNAYSK